MDPELRQAFATLSGQVADVGRDARAAVDLGRANAHAIAQLQHAVFGSTPPPPPGGAVPVAARVTDAEHGLDAVHGVVLAVEGRTERLETAVATTQEAVARLEEATAAQSRAWGVGARTVRDFLASREGKKILLHLATAAAVAYAALREPSAAHVELRAPVAQLPAPSGTLVP